MKKLFIILLFISSLAYSQAPSKLRGNATVINQGQNWTWDFTTDSDTTFIRSSNKVKIDSLVDVNRLSVGTVGQVPYSNAGGTDVDYSSNFVYDGDELFVNDGATFNESGLAGKNFRIESDNSDSIFFVDTDNDQIRIISNEGGLIIGGGTNAPRLATARDAARGSLTVQPIGGDSPGSVEVFPSGTSERSHFLTTNANDPDNFGFVEWETNVGDSWLHSSLKGTGTAPTTFKIYGFDDDIRFLNNVIIGEEDTALVGLEIQSGSNTTIAPLLDVPNGSLWIGNGSTSAGISIGQNVGVYSWIQTRNEAAGSGNSNDLALNPLGGFVGVGNQNPTALFHIGDAGSGATAKIQFEDDLLYLLS